MLRRTAIVLALGVAVLAVTGCRLTLDVDVAVDRHGGGTLSLALAADGELMARAERAGADPLTDLAGTVRELDGWRVVEGSDDEGGRSVAASARFRSAAELEAAVAEIAVALAAPEATLLEPLRLELTADTLRLEGAAGLVPTEHVTELGLLPDDAVRLVADTDAVHYTVRATMPGAILSSNATAEEGNTAAWRVEPGERVELELVAERPGAPVLAILLGGLVGALAVLAAIRFVRRRARARSG